MSKITDFTLVSEVKGRLERNLQLDARGILDFALEEYRDRIAIISSFGVESAVLLHMVSAVDPNVPILFLNTGKLFGETLRYRDRLQDVLGLSDVRTLGPTLEQRETVDPDGTLWSRDADVCCKLRKIVPLQRALTQFAAQVTGRKRFQTAARATMEPVELQEGRLCFNPLWQWTLQELSNYAALHQLPAHPLTTDGYLSVGCLPCTTRVHPGASYRAGRWAGIDKEECGIHSTIHG